MKYYTGKKPCLGCNRSGTEQWRPGVDALCNDCQKAIKFANRIWDEAPKDETLTSLNLREVPLRFLKDHKPYDLLPILNKILKSLARPYLGAIPGKARNNYIEIGSPYSNGNCYILLNEDAETIKELSDFLSAYSQALYEEAKQEGSNLLFMLNSGEITLNQFEKGRQR